MAVSLAPVRASIKDLVDQAGEAGVSGAHYINPTARFVTLVDPSNDRTSRVAAGLVDQQLRKGFRYPAPGELTSDGRFTDGRKQHTVPPWAKKWADEVNLEETPEEAVLRLEQELERTRNQVALRAEKISINAPFSAVVKSADLVRHGLFMCTTCRKELDTEHGLKIHVARVHGGTNAHRRGTVLPPKRK